MGHITRTIIAGAALLGCGLATAHADGSIKDYRAVEVASPSVYVRGDYSYAWQDAGDLSQPGNAFNSSIDNTWALGVGIGRYFGHGIRGDVTYEWRDQTDVAGAGVGCGGCFTNFGIRSQVVLANLYYDFRPGERFTPYVGAGLGAARLETTSGQACGCFFSGDSTWNLAGALMAGFSWRLDRPGRAPVSIKDTAEAPSPGRLYLDVGYRYLFLGDAHTGLDTGTGLAGPKLENLAANEFRVGVRWDLR